MNISGFASRQEGKLGDPKGRIARYREATLTSVGRSARRGFSAIQPAPSPPLGRLPSCTTVMGILMTAKRDHYHHHHPRDRKRAGESSTKNRKKTKKWQTSEGPARRWSNGIDEVAQKSQKTKRKKTKKGRKTGHPVKVLSRRIALARRMLCPASVDGIGKDCPAPRPGSRDQCDGKDFWVPPRLQWILNPFFFVTRVGFVVFGGNLFHYLPRPCRYATLGLVISRWRKCNLN